MREIELLHRSPSAAAVNRILDNVDNDTERSLVGGHDWVSQSVGFHEKQ